MVTHSKFVSKGNPISRVSNTIHEFMIEEKFDTWLDLDLLRKFTKVAEHAPGWHTRSFKPMNRYFSAETVCFFRQLGFTPQQIGSSIVSALLPARLINRALKSTTTDCHVDKSNMRHFLSLIKESSVKTLNHQMAHLVSNCSEKLKNNFYEDSEIWEEKIKNMPPILATLLAINEDLIKVVDVFKQYHNYLPRKDVIGRVSSRLRQVPAIIPVQGLKGKFVVTQDILLWIENGRQYILDKNLFLEVYNKLAEVFCGLLYAHFCSGVSKPKNHVDIMRRFIIHITEKLSFFQCDKRDPRQNEKENKGFSYLKIMEGLGVAELIKRSDYAKGWRNDDLAKNLWKSVYDDKLDCNENYTESPIFQLFKEMSTSQIASMLGLVKLCGHPSIDIMNGLDKLERRTHENIEVDYEAVRRSIRVLKRDLFKQFYLVNRKYPNCTYDRLEQTNPLYRLLASNKSPVKDLGLEMWNRIRPADWDHVIIMKTEEFDPIDNQLILLKDKALGLDKSKVMKFILETHPEYEESADNMTEMRSMEVRRALLAFLLTPHFSTEFTRYFNAYQHEPIWTEAVLNYLVIKLTAKELEEKPEGRYFGASPLQERNRRIVQEYNVMRIMDKYVPDQLMTPNELEMIRKLYSFRHLKSVYPHFTILQVSFDFSKWNNSMRRDSIDIPGQEVIDQFYGTTLYGATMKAYENTLVYYKDATNERYWQGQLGGIEGLNQNTWSWIFSGGIKQALESIGTLYQLTVKGDDVRCALIIPGDTLVEAQIIVMRDRILNALSNLCLAMGWTLNPHECFVSLGVICTSKQYQFNDTWLPADDKKMIKCESLSNLVFPTLEDLVSSIYSTAHSACSQATVVLPSYATATFLAARLLCRSFWMQRLSADDITLLLLWPQILGGPGALPLQTFLVRGENDMLSVSISLLRHVYIADKQDFGNRVLSLLSIPLEENPNLRQLFSDPYSLPLKAPPRASSVLKSMIRSQLPRWVKNEHILTLLEQETQNDKEEVANTLLSMDPFYPKLVCAIWECTPFVLLDEIVEKFMQSSTIFAFISRTRKGVLNKKFGLKQLSRVVEAAKHRAKYWIRIIKTPCNLESHYLGVRVQKWNDYMRVCTTEIIHEVRNKAWRKNIKGITYPSLVDQNMIYHPADLISDELREKTEQITTQITIAMRSKQYQTDDASDHYAAAPGIIPWLGSTTSSKLEFPKFERQIRSPTISKILRLLGLIRSGTYFGTGFIQVVKGILRGLTSVDPDSLNVLVPEAGGGHICHRVEINSFSMATMPNYRPNISQLLNINNENLGILRGDTRNRTINFAARHFFLTALALYPLQCQTNLHSTHPELIEVIFHGKIDENDTFRLCDYCCNIVDDEPVTFSRPLRTLLIKYSQMPLVGASSYEKGVLQRNIISAIDHKKRRLIEGAFLNEDNPEHQAIAFQTIVKMFSLARTEIYHRAKAAEYERIPQGELLDILGVNLGTHGIKTERVSIRLIRAIPAERLYECILNEVFYHFISQVGMELLSIDLFLLKFQQSHHSPLANFFAEIAFCGRLGALSRGAKDKGLLDRPIQWPAGSANNGAAAYRTFFLAHKEIFLRWYQAGLLPPFVRNFVHLEDDVTVREVLVEMGRIRKRSLLVKMMHTWRPPTAYGGIVKGVKKMRDPDLDDDIDDPLNAIVDRYIHLIQIEFQHAYHAIEIDPQNPIAKLSELVFVAYCSKCLKYGELQDDTLSDNELMQKEIVILDAAEDIDFMLSDLTEATKESDVLWMFLSKLLGEENGVILWRVLQRVVEINQFVDWCLTLHAELNDSMQTWLKNFGKVSISLLSEDGAARLIDQFAQKVHRLHIHELAPIQEADEDDNEDDLELMHYTCHSHHVPLVHEQPGRQVPPSYDYQYLLQELQELHRLAHTEISFRYIESLPFLDWRSLGRMSYTINQACIHWIDVLYKTDLLPQLARYRSSVSIVVLGDGTGAICDLLTRVNRHVHVIYCSLQRDTSSNLVVADAAYTNPPYEFLRGDADDDRIQRIHWEGMYPGDITVEGVREIISRRMLTLGCECIGVISDIEYPTRRDQVHVAINIFKSIIHMLTTIPQPNFFFCTKIFNLVDMTSIQFIYALRESFNHLHLRTSSYDKSNTTPVYLMATKPNCNLRSPLLEEIFSPTPRVLPNYSGIASLRYLISHLGVIPPLHRQWYITTLPDLKQLYMYFTTYNLPAPNFDIMWKKLDIQTLVPGGHFCGVINTIKDAIYNDIVLLTECEDKIKFNIESKTQTGRPLRRLPVKAPTFSARNTKVAEARSNTFDRISNIVTLYACWNVWECFNCHHALPQVGFGMQVFNNTINHLIDWVIKYSYLGQISVESYHYTFTSSVGNIDLHKLISKAVEISMRLVGQFLVMCQAYGYPSQDNRQMRETWIPNITAEACCIEYAKKISDQLENGNLGTVNDLLLSDLSLPYPLAPVSILEAPDTIAVIRNWKLANPEVKVIRSLADRLFVPETDVVQAQPVLPLSWADEVELELGGY